MKIFAFGLIVVGAMLIASDPGQALLEPHLGSKSKKPAIGLLFVVAGIVILVI